MNTLLLRSPVCVLVALLLALGSTDICRAADAPPPLPADLTAWVNSVPLSYEQLKGKAVILVFFQEQCPKCKEAWPKWMSTAKANAEKYPVIYIAVNSGTSRQAVELYARQMKVTWPIIVDSDRSLEKAYDVKEISLQNTPQIDIVKAGGEIVPTSADDDFDDVIKSAAEGATWNVDPQNIQSKLVKPLWQQIEFGHFAGLALPLKKLAISNDPDTKRNAVMLQEYMQSVQDSLAAAATEASEAGQKYKASEIVAEISEKFKGQPLPEEVTKLKKELGKDPTVKAGTVAYKQLTQIRRQAAIANASTKQKLATTLSGFIETYPDTKLAAEAKAILDKLEAEPVSGPGAGKNMAGQ